MHGFSSDCFPQFACGVSFRPQHQHHKVNMALARPTLVSVFRQKWLHRLRDIRPALLVSSRELHSSYSGGMFTTPIPEFEDKPDINSFQDLYDFSIRRPTEFWGTLARSRLRWRSPFKTVMDCNMNEGRIKWFLNGKLNVSGGSHPPRASCTWATSPGLRPMTSGPKFSSYSTHGCRSHC